MTSTQKKVLALSWVTYASFYLLRVNMSVAIPGIMATFNLSKTVMGGVESAFFLLYALGQFVNGQLVDQFGAKRVLSIGLGMSIAISLAIPSFGGIVALLTVLWGANGFVQAMGWSPTVKVVNSWFPEKSRVSGILATSYIVGGALSWVLAGQVARLGWEEVFRVPAAFCIAVLTAYVFLMKERPGPAPPRLTLGDQVLSCVGNRQVWFAGFGLFGLNIVRYGFLVWAPTFFFETQRAEITSATYKALIFPLAGALGSLAVGWLTSRWFRERKGVVALLLTSVLAITCFLLPLSPDWTVSLALLAVIGFTVFGPHSYVVTQLPMLLGCEGDTGSITGFIDGMGYIGAAITGFVSGLLADQFSWNHALYFWVLGAVIAGLFMFLSARE